MTELHMEHLLRCPVCQSENLSSFTTVKDFERTGTEIYQLNVCSHCQLKFLNPRPPENGMARYYQESYYKLSVVSHKLSTLKQQALTYWHHYPQSVKNSFWQTLMLKVAKPLAKNKLGRQIPDFVVNGSLLEIGVGRGEFLLKMRELGWKTTGIDISPVAVNYLREHYNLNVQLANSRQLPFAANSFDIVYLSHTLEHIHDPVVVLKEICRVLKPGGQVLITTPNIGSLGRKLFGIKWAAYEPPLHVIIYETKSLTCLLSATGFDIQSCKAPATNSASVFQRSFAIVFQNRFLSINRVLSRSYFFILWVLSLIGIYFGDELHAVGVKQQIGA